MAIFFRKDREVGWGEATGFPIRQMPASVTFGAISGAESSLFFRFSLVAEAAAPATVRATLRRATANLSFLFLVLG